MRRIKVSDRITLEIYQHDWMPAFAAFHAKTGRKRNHAPKHIVINIGSLLATVATGDVPAKELPYFVAETLMHEIIHALEEWAGIEFSEERVEELIEQYREKYQPPVTKVWKRDGKKRKNRYTRKPLTRTAEKKGQP